jgi:hypothetical protein
MNRPPDRDYRRIQHNWKAMPQILQAAIWCARHISADNFKQRRPGDGVRAPVED